MRNFETAKRCAKGGCAALAMLAGLALAPAPAQAQVCGDLDEIAEELLDAYYDAFGEFLLFGWSEKTCDSMTNTFFKACNTAVKDAVKCAQRQIGEIPKAAKPLCKEASKVPSECEGSYKDDAEDASDSVSDEAQGAYDDCELAADDFWDICRFGPP